MKIKNIFVKRKPLSHVLMLFFALLTGLAGSYVIFKTKAAVVVPPAPYVWQEHNVTHVANIRGQFNDTQLRLLATNYGQVQISGFHGAFKQTAHFEAARLINQLNPNVKIFDYLNTKFWYNSNDKQFNVTFNPDWYLKDINGNKIPFYGRAGSTTPVAYYIDMSNADYRAWATSMVAGWMQQAPYTGMLFDSADPIGVNDPNQIRLWNNSIGPAKIQAWNDGLKAFLSQTSATFHAMNKQVLYNGISPHPFRGLSRNTELLNVSDGADDEEFCLKQGSRGQQSASENLEDINLMGQYSNKKIMMFTIYDNNEQLHFGPYCFGSFMMGWVPGSSYFSFASSYEPTQLDYFFPEMNLNLGNPVGSYVQSGNLLTRKFEHGYVVVNTDKSSAQVILPGKLIEFANGTQKQIYDAGSQYTVAGQGAGFFLYDSFLNPSSASIPSPIPSSTGSKPSAPRRSPAVVMQPSVNPKAEETVNGPVLLPTDGGSSSSMQPVVKPVPKSLASNLSSSPKLALATIVTYLGMMGLVITAAIYIRRHVHASKSFDLRPQEKQPPLQPITGAGINEPYKPGQIFHPKDSD